MIQITLELQDKTSLKALFILRIYTNQLTYLEIIPIRRIV